MSFEQCIDDKLKANKIRPAKRTEAINRFKGERERWIAQGVDPARAETEAAASAIQRATAEAEATARANLFHEAWKPDVENAMRSFKGTEAADAAKATIEGSAKGPYKNLLAVRAVREGEAQTMLADLIDKFGPRGLAHKPVAAGQDELLRAIFGEGNTGQWATAIAKSWQTYIGHSMDLWHMFGGTRRLLEDWHVPNPDNNVVKLMRARGPNGENKWVDMAMEHVDWNRVTHKDGSPVAVTDRRKFLSDIYETKITDGAFKDGKAPFFMDRERVLHYKSADSWQKMHDAFGDGTVYDVMQHHIKNVSHDLALIEVFSPRPEEGMQFVRKTAIAMAAEKDVANPNLKRSARLDTEEALKRFDQMWEAFNGRYEAGPENTLAHVGGSGRNLLSSAMLGSASLAAIPGDFMTTAHANLFNNLPVVTGFKNYLSLMVHDKDAVRVARTSGLVLDNVISNAYAIERFSGMSSTGTAWSKAIGEGVMKLSLMSQHTANLRSSWSLDLMGQWAQHAAKSFDEMPLKSMFERYGVTATEWDKFRGGPQYDFKGASLLRPLDWLNKEGKSAANIELYTKLMGLIHDEVRYAVPAVGLESSVALKGGTQPGTLIGEVARSFAMFKNFSHEILLLYGRRGMMEQGQGGRLAYYGSLGLMLTLAGAASVQMKELVSGREPIPMDSVSFWTKSMLAGGAMGVFGDFLFSGVNRFGNGPKDVAAGPVVQFLGDFTDLTAGNVSKLIHGQDTTFVPDAIRVASQATPGTSLWYARLALQRQMWDQLMLEFDPKARSKFARRVSVQKHDYGNDYWAPPGQSLF